MLKEQIEILPTWAISWQAPLTPDPTMIPPENLFLLNSPVQLQARDQSLTATIADLPGLLFHSPDALISIPSSGSFLHPRQATHALKGCAEQNRKGQGFLR